MDLDLTDEQTWLSESVETLLSREWPAAELAHDAGPAERERLWHALAEFGALSVDRTEGMGAVELTLVARALGAHLASTPFVAGAAVRYALERTDTDLGDDRIALALLEPGRSWSLEGLSTTVDGGRLHGRKVAVEHADAIDRFAVVTVDGLVLVPAGLAGIEIASQPALDASAPMSAVSFDVAVDIVVDAVVLDRLLAIGGLLAAAEAVGAAGRILDDAVHYASERRQFGRTIGSNQALRHLMADMYVRQASSWSTVLYAAAALDDDLGDAHATASIAKAYVSRAAREVALGAMQVFGGIAFTEEHPAHRFLRRIVVREQQFGDAAHHERRLGRMLAARAAARLQDFATASVIPSTVG